MKIGEIYDDEIDFKLLSATSTDLKTRNVLKELEVAVGNSKVRYHYSTRRFTFLMFYFK